MLCALVKNERTFSLEFCFLLVLGYVLVTIFLRSEKKLLKIFYLFLYNCVRIKGINKI